MAMQIPVVASIQQAPSGFVQHCFMPPVIQLPVWDAHTYYQASQAVEFGDSVWMGDPEDNAARWQGGYLAANSQLSYPTSDGESTKAPSSPRSGPGSGGSESHVSVVLSGLPKILCSMSCLEVAIQQACHECDVVTFEVKMTRGVGEAVVILRTEFAAQLCMRHFTNLRCAKSLPVVARYDAEAGRRLMARRNGAHSARDEPPCYKPQASKPAPKLRKQTRKIGTSKHQFVPEIDASAVRSTEADVAATSRPLELVTCAEVGTEAVPTKYMVVARPSVARSPMPSVIGSPMKSGKLWADYDDDTDDDEDGFYWGKTHTRAP